MASVENRVVRMEFDNATFEARVKQTLASLAQLDKAIKMEGAAKGLSDVSEAAGRVNLNPLATSIQSVSAGFLALSTIAITALSTITSRAISAGAQMVKSLSMQPILDGFAEYELNMGSIQTILANTKADGTNLEQVSAALDQLNTYSDKTIYNFGQMARNIGTFTAAGVDLQTSVDSIKGISNLAAISGSTAEQASTAMYQLSQAISTGTLRLMDWNSVVNAGMGGEVFQKALFNTGVAMGTITNAPVGTTFEEWTAAGNSFRDSLQEGWLTSEVLTNTLRGFTGDMTEAQLLAIGYTKEQAQEILALGQTGVEAATKVRTLTGLMQTLKEGLASGWAQSFRVILGDFEEATQLFTGLSNSIGGFFSRQADARNAVLQGWADLGGRGVLLQGLENSFDAIARILVQVGKAFREVFPATTAQRLFEMTQRFTEFTASLKPSEQTLNNVKRIATGLFAALDIGWEIIKAGVGFVKDLVVQLTGLGSGTYLEGAADILDFFVRLRDSLEGGAKVQEFFDNLAEAVQKPIQFVKDLKDAIFDFFGAFADAGGDAASNGVDRVSQRFETLQAVFERLGAVGEFLMGILEALGQVASVVGDAIGDWFGELADKLREAIDPAEFDAILDALNVSLLGGIGLLIANFLRGGISFDVGDGLFSNISSAFEQLTGTLEAMQTSIRADALLKIAGAVGILAASMVVLSLIDSAALTRALVAMAVGFTQLMAAFALLNAFGAGLTSGATFTIIATGMIALAGAVVVLSAAVAILAQLSWGELAKGLVGVTVLLGALTGAAILLSQFSGQILLSSIGLVAIAGAIVILTGAVALLAQLSWQELLQGLGGLAAILVVVVGAAVVISKHASGILASAVALSVMGVALNILAGAVAIFGNMDLATLGTGIVAIAVMLGLLVVAAVLLSKHVAGILVTSVALIALAVALNIIAGAMRILSGMSWGEIAKGLVAMAGAMLILAVAANAMTGAVAGAGAMLIMAASVAILAGVLIKLGEVPFGDILKALGGIVLAIAALGIAAALLQPVIPALLGLGVALLAVGGAFALFGIGAYGVARAFQILSEAGPDAADAIVEALKAIGRAIPAVATGLAQGILELIRVFAEAAGPIAEALGVLLGHLLDTVKDLLPKVGDVFLALIETILEVITEAYPQIIEAGLGMILALLTGLSENIEPIVAAGLALLVNFLNGIASGIPQIYQAVANLIAAFLLGVQSFTQTIIDTGVQLLVNFLLGITNNLVKIVETVGTMIITFIWAVANLATSIAQAGTDALVNFLSGMTNNVYKVTEAVGTLITTFITSVANLAGSVVAAGANAIIDFVQGLGAHVNRIVAAGVTVIIKFLEGVAGQTLRLATAAADILINFLNALAQVIEEKSAELRQAGKNIAFAIADGISGGLASKARDLANDAIGMAEGVVGGVTNFLGISSPSKVFYGIGQNIVDGLANGMSNHAASDRSAKKMANDSVAAARKVLTQVVDEMSNIDDWSTPVITPVLDTAQMESDFNSFYSGLNSQPLKANTSFQTAQSIARSPSPTQPTSTDSEGNRGVTFNQTINSPTELSTADIYKNTRNQITLAKEELDVP